MRMFSRKRKTTEPSVRRGPTMDAELPMALFAAVLAAIALFAIQLEASAASARTEATKRTASVAGQSRPYQQLAGAARTRFADTFEQRIR
jgi:hypothetical protein